MESVKLRQIVRELLEYYVSLGASHRTQDNPAFVLVDKDENHFQWMRLGWLGQRRVYGCVMHLEVKDNKIWVHQDNTDLDPVGALLERNILPSDIVLAFHPPYVRKDTGFAVG